MSEGTLAFEYTNTVNIYGDYSSETICINF